MVPGFIAWLLGGTKKEIASKPRLKCPLMGAFLLLTFINMKPKLIALYSSAPQSGKSTIAEILKEEGYKTVSFATPLKDMTVRFLMGFGYSKGDSERIIKDKDFVIGEVDLRVRDIMQRLGTEWGREMIHKNVWIKMWEARQRLFPLVVVDDMRFPNEYEMVKKYGGVMLKVHRDEAIRQSTEQHASEGALDSFEFDQVIENNGTISQLYDKVLSIIA